MRAMILAAGRGERMRPLTDHCPKPLLPVAGKALIVYHLERLAAAGFQQIIINHAHLGEQLLTSLGDGSQWGLSIHWSAEPMGALETAGGIRLALPQLDDGQDTPFLVINGDIYCDWPIQQLALAATDLAHLVLVPNPVQHPNGDFALNGQRVSDQNPDTAAFTFAGIGYYRPSLFQALSVGQPAKLAPLLRAAMQTKQVSGELYTGRWEDVGTPDRLNRLDQELRASCHNRTI